MGAGVHVDILLIDDVQFLSGKERTKVELFRILESLQAREKQILLVSDRHPKDIEDVSERLISRFVSGIIIETGLDEQTKLSIVKHKLLLYGLPTDTRHIDYVMENTGYSVREIEGFIKTIKLTGIKEQGRRETSREEKVLSLISALYAIRKVEEKRCTDRRFDYMLQVLEKNTRKHIF